MRYAYVVPFSFGRADTTALMDETPLMLNNAKRKLRLVLSTTDLHTADFRHTSVSVGFEFDSWFCQSKMVYF